MVYGYECKKHGPGSPVRVGIVREFAAALRNKKIANGVLCTTATFTADALAESQVNMIYPQDVVAIHKWIQDLALPES